MRVALCQINTIIGDFEGNSGKVIEYSRRARAAGADIAVFPEMTLTGYPPRDLLERRSFVERCRVAVSQVAEATRGLGDMAVVVGAISRNPEPGKPLFNEAVVLSGGETISVHRKMLLPSYDVFDEERYFEPSGLVVQSHFQNQKIGVTICEDIWNDKQYWSGGRYRTNPILVAGDAALLVNISASPYSWGKGRLRYDMLSQVARSRSVPVVYVNLVGGNDSLVFDGRSLAVGADGTLLAVGAPFEEDLLVVDIPLDGTAATPLTETLGRVGYEEMEGIFRALVLGLRDYARKCGFKRVVLGLSGGIDSAVTAAIAAEALGPDNVLGAFMPTRYSSELSRAEARALAGNLGVRYKEIPIDGIFESYLVNLEAGLEGLPGDHTEENIQARIRGNVLMALSNRFGHLVLSTGNKSEMAVGYCTLYGDMSGGLSVISDLYKTEVYRLAEFMNNDRERIPPGTLHRVPSAELRPNQKDQDTLPPYDLLDQILRLYIDENQDFDAIIGAGFDAGIVADVIRRVEANEYKRQQAAPGLRVSWKAFGMGRRYPIARRLGDSLTAAKPAQPPARGDENRKLV